MASIDEERALRLRPPKPRIPRRENAAWSSGFKLLMHYARSSRKHANRSFKSGKRGNIHPYRQHCAVRVTYLKNKTRGLWKAHGRYLAREGATQENSAGKAGFNRGNAGIDVPAETHSWQKAGDERLWKLILSPEFGGKLDLPRFTRDLMERVEKDLGTGLEWIAVEHHNTGHPHVHIVIRGVTSEGVPLRMGRDYIQHGIRSVAEDLCTRQLGFRTELDAIEAERREINEKRFTTLDRRILRVSADDSPGCGPQYFSVTRNPAERGLSETERVRAQHEAARLCVLQRMGLAEATAAGTWIVRRDFERVLRAMQRAADRQKTLAKHGALLSDERLPLEVLDLAQMTRVEGRVLVHGQDEQSGRSYLMLEGVDAKVHFVYYTPEMEQARNRGELRTNSFVVTEELSPDGYLDVQDLGDAENLLSDPRYLSQTATQLLKRGIVPKEDGWGGWLGRYQAALRKAATEVTQRQQRESQHNNNRSRQRDRSLGR